MSPVELAPESAFVEDCLRGNLGLKLAERGLEILCAFSKFSDGEGGEDIIMGAGIGSSAAGEAVCGTGERMAGPDDSATS